MRKVRRDEIVDYQTWAEDRKTAVQPAILEAKRRRRVHVGPHLTFLFENADTIRYQVQEMMRIERIVREDAIRHEIDTYNELIGDEGEIGCALLIEIEDASRRDQLLRRWRGMESHWYARLPDGTRVPATFDPRQVGDERLSSVQYLRFRVGDQVPVAIGADHPDYTHEAVLDEEQRAALAADLAS